MKDKVWLINLYEGRIEQDFDTTGELTEYLNRKKKDGSLMGAGAYTVAIGNMLKIENFYPRG